MASNSIDVTWEERRRQAVEQARAVAMPLTMGKVFWAVLLANIVSAIIIGLVIGMDHVR